MTNESAEQDHAERLFRLSQERADELGKTLTDVAREADVSTQALYQWRRGVKRQRNNTDRAISHALGWEPGSRKAILEGEDPTPLAVEPTGPRTGRPLKIFDDAREQRIWDQNDVLTEEERLDLIAYLRQRDQRAQLGDEIRRRHAG